MKESSLAGKCILIIMPATRLKICRKIIDDHYAHALRLYRDRPSGGVRLQASVFSGDLKRYFRPTSKRSSAYLRRLPVWTAFITHQFQSSTWMTKPSQKVIHLADLQRYIFTDDYNPQIAPSGEHELTFATTSGKFIDIPIEMLLIGTDLRAFVRAIDDLRWDDESTRWRNTTTTISRWSTSWRNPF